MRTVPPHQRSIAACVRASLVWQIASVAFGYAVCAQFAATYAMGSDGAVVLWLPNAVVLTALLLTPVRRWWVFGLTQVLVALLVGAGAQELPQALGIALANGLEVLLSAWLIRRYCGRGFAFSNVREVVLFAAIALGVAPGLSALLGTWIHYRAAVETVSFVEHWQTGWIGNGMGLVVLTPLLYGWLHVPAQAALRPATPWLERLVFAALLGALLWLLFFSRPDRASPWVASPLLLLPLILWAALRFGTLGVSLVGCVVSLLAIVLTYQGRGMFSLLDAGLQTRLLQQYLAALLLTGVTVAAIVNDLGALNQQLEQRVAQRTVELERLATTDALTDAHNRRFLMARAEVEMALAARQSHAVSMVMFDIDHFKRINDSHGHNVGDRVLVALSQAVRAELRLGDTFARVGGEEFVMLLPRSDAAQAWLVAERLRAMVEGLAVDAGNGLVLHITASFGVSTSGSATSSVDALYVAADQALYRAKAAGRNCVVASAHSS